MSMSNHQKDSRPPPGGRLPGGHERHAQPGITGLVLLVIMNQRDRFVL